MRVDQWQADPPVILGMGAGAQTSLQLRDNGGVNTQVNFGNPLDRLGARDVTDLAGNPVEAFSLTSAASAADWGTCIPPVPETSSWAILLAGLSLLGVTTRR